MGGKGSGKKKDRTKSGAPGTEGNAQAWADAAKTAGGEQGRLPIEAADEKHVEAELTVDLSIEDVAKAAHEAASAQKRIDDRNREIAQLQTEIDSRKKDQKELKTANEEDDATRGRLLREVDTGKRVTLVPCIEVHRYPHTVTTFRAKADGTLGERVSERAMTDEERKASTFAPKGPVPVVAAPPDEDDEPVPVNTKAEA